MDEAAFADQQTTDFEPYDDDTAALMEWFSQHEWDDFGSPIEATAIDEELRAWHHQPAA